MRVLFQSRSDILTRWGGDTTQITATRQCLEELGHSISMCNETAQDLAEVDLVHVFNIQTANQTLPHIINAKNHGKPVVLSPIYWDLHHTINFSDYLTYHTSPAVRAAAHVSKLSATMLIQMMRSRRKEDMVRMLSLADIILPNSFGELEILCQLFDMPELRAKAVFVPNGVSANVEGQMTAATEKLLGSLPDKYIMQVASFDPGKGQLSLIRAMMNDFYLPLVFIGSGNKNVYGKACRRLAKSRGNVTFIDSVAHDQMAHYYRRAKVHVLPSLRESPGLATLEAAIYGANCVVSIHGPIGEYFDHLAWICDPKDEQSITKAVVSAWEAKYCDDLANRILANFTWQKAALATLAGYNLACNK